MKTESEFRFQVWLVDKRIDEMKLFKGCLYNEDKTKDRGSEGGISVSLEIKSDPKPNGGTHTCNLGTHKVGHHGTEAKPCLKTSVRVKRTN